jgi:hypothetical protein
MVTMFGTEWAPVVAAAIFLLGIAAGFGLFWVRHESRPCPKAAPAEPVPDPVEEPAPAPGPLPLDRLLEARQYMQSLVSSAKFVGRHPIPPKHSVEDSVTKDLRAYPGVKGLRPAVPDGDQS